MAAATVTTFQRNVIGNKRENLFVINLAATGDTLDSGLKRVEAITANSHLAVSNMTASGKTITFTTTGAVTGLQVRAVGI